MASKINGWLRQRMRADDMTWLWRYQRLRARDGKIVENFLRLGLVAEIGDEPAAWRRVGELGLVEKYITLRLSGKPTFCELCAAYVKDGLPFRKRDGRRKSKGTIETYQYHIDNILKTLVSRFCPKRSSARIAILATHRCDISKIAITLPRRK